MAASSRFKLPPPLLWLVVVGQMAVPAAQAQRLAYEVTNRYTRAPVASGVVDVATGATTATTPDEAQVYGVFTSDGQFAVSAAAGGTLLVRHMPTGAGSLVAADFRPSLAHPRRLMIFGYTGAGAVARLDVRGVATMTQCPPGANLPGLALSLDGSELFVACDTADIVVVDTETTAERRRVPALPHTSSVFVNAQGELVAAGVGPLGPEVARLDATTGQELARRDALRVWAGTGSRRLLLEMRPSATPGVIGIYRLVDAATLTTTPLPFSLALGVSVFVSPDGRDAVLASSGYSVYTPSVVSRIEVATGRVLAKVVLPQEQTAAVQVSPAPLPPANPTAEVADGQVSLAWHLPAESPQVTGYRLEAGVAPGTAAVSLDLGAATSATIPGVPPGRYYVRIRAVNYNGVSAPSNEVVIDVP